MFTKARYPLALLVIVFANKLYAPVPTLPQERYDLAVQRAEESEGVVKEAYELIAQKARMDIDSPANKKSQKLPPVPQASADNVKVFGLMNGSNICYMNAAMQCLIHFPGFNKGLLEALGKASKDVIEKGVTPFSLKSLTLTNDYKKPANKILYDKRFTDLETEYNVSIEQVPLKAAPIIFNEYKKLVATPVGKIAPTTDYRKAVIDTLFTGYDYATQHDSPEFLDKFFDLCKNALHFSPFTFGATGAIKCLTCNNVSLSDPPNNLNPNVNGRSLNILLLEMPDKSPLVMVDCIQHYFEIEKLENGARYNCITCSQQDQTISFEEREKTYTNANKYLMITQASSMLVIQLKRFAFDFIALRDAKKDNRISGFMHIKIPVTQPDKSIVEVAYDLCGIVYHIGGRHGGHYIASVKRDKTWYNCNDTTVTNIGDEKIDESKLVGSIHEIPYIFFYQRVEEDAKNKPIP